MSRGLTLDDDPGTVPPPVAPEEDADDDDDEGVTVGASETRRFLAAGDDACRGDGTAMPLLLVVVLVHCWPAVPPLADVMVVVVAHRGIVDLRDTGTCPRDAVARLSLATLPLLLPPPWGDGLLLLLFDGGKGGVGLDPAPARVCLWGLTGIEQQRCSSSSSRTGSCL